MRGHGGGLTKGCGGGSSAQWARRVHGIRLLDGPPAWQGFAPEPRGFRAARGRRWKPRVLLARGVRPPLAAPPRPRPAATAAARCWAPLQGRGRRCLGTATAAAAGARATINCAERPGVPAHATVDCAELPRCAARGGNGGGTGTRRGEVSMEAGLRLGGGATTAAELVIGATAVYGAGPGR